MNKRTLSFCIGSSRKELRHIIGLSMIGLIDFSIISSYQLGIINRLPDVPNKLFDSNKVNASSSSFRWGIPDGILGAAAYTSNIVLAAASLKKRDWRKDLLLFFSIGGNAAGALLYLYDMTFVQKKICLYCVLGVAINLFTLKLTRPSIG